MTYQSPAESPRFKFACSYQGSTWFDVWDRTGIYQVELRQRADEYERKYYNGDDADWQRNVVDMIGVLRRASGCDVEIPAETLLAFNYWRAAEHEAHLASMRSQPERYGTDFSDIKVPMLAKAAGVYRNGWIITYPAQQAAA